MKIVRQFVPLAVQGIVFVAACMVSTMTGVLRGLWQQSHLIATAYLGRAGRAGMDAPFEAPMYWFIRITSFVMMCALLKFVADVMWFLIRYILHW